MDSKLYSINVDEIELNEFTNSILKNILLVVNNNLSNAPLTSTNLALVINFTLHAVEDAPVKGPQQLNYALMVIKKLINDLNDSDEKKCLTMLYNNGSIKDTIQMVVDATKGKLNINKVSDVVNNSCLPLCIGYLFTKINNNNNKHNNKAGLNK